MLRTMSSTARVALGSRLAVGSSRNRTSGRSAHARASARRCCSPPDSTRAERSASCVEADLGQRVGNARVGARHRATPASFERIANVARRRSPQHAPPAGTPWPGARPPARSGSPQRIDPARRREQPVHSAQQHALARAVRSEDRRVRARAIVRSTADERCARASNTTSTLAAERSAGARCRPQPYRTRLRRSRDEVRRGVEQQHDRRSARGRAPARAAGRPCSSRARSSSSSRG